MSARHPTRARVKRGDQASISGAGAPRNVRLLDGRHVCIAAGAGIDQVIREIARGQRGRVRRGQLLAVGVTRGAIDRRVANDRLELLHRGVYGLPSTGDLPLAAETAALLACGEAAALSHHSAAVLWGLRPGVARPIHVTVPGDRGCRAPNGVVVHRSTTLTPADIRVHNGLPVTSPARTLLDVAINLPDREIERLLDEALFVKRILTIGELRGLIARAGTHPGRARLNRVVAKHVRSTVTDSPPEEALLGLVRAAALPEPRLHVEMLGYVLDFFWPELLLAVEVDAYGTHGSRARFEADRRRDARLLAEKGIVVVRLTRAAIEGRSYEVIGILARASGQREAALRSAPFEVGW